MSSRYSEAQKQAATAYFSSKSGIILEEGEKPSGNYVYQVQINGSNKRFKIDNDHLYWWEHKSGHWNWKPIPEAKLPRLDRRIKQLDAFRESLLSEMEKAT
ncbi:hypothetical protein I6N96_03315 [Enterococcus sp. BWM-S5]|uniref:Uncharacterized protein n=1 Tax=Enterococcus larvae TaxID=2794352 RepID=A0ABS4CH60_9ENTE|nr:hypothetical protein [Enterococcus larvae]MBP1045292.1 hypothetical protein [Enterococcus larvae]